MHNLLALTANSGGGLSWIMLVVWVVVLVGMMYFLSIRPQRKEQQKHDQLMASLEIGDSVCTTAGFYGVVIGIEEDIVIVEFGSNKNCRIPMKKSAIVEVEKA